MPSTLVAPEVEARLPLPPPVAPPPRRFARVLAVFRAVRVVPDTESCPCCPQWGLTCQRSSDTYLDVLAQSHPSLYTMLPGA